jgi:acyl carrier protein/short-subunit dehydrogenase
VLTGRSAIPERDERESWLATHGEEDVTSARIRAVQTLEELGADVMVAAADVTDLEQMHAVVAGACERFGTIDRVLHTAGVPGGGIIQLKTPEMASGVLAPKVTGTLVLEQVLADVQPAQVVLFSSLSAVMGEFGQADYCGANAFLDAFAHQNRGTVTAISWDIWQEVGMTVRTSVPDAVKEWREEQLALGMLSSEGVDVYRRALASGLPQVVVCTMDVEARTEQFRSLTRSRILGAVDQLLPSPGAVHPRPEMRTPYLAPRNDLERTVAAIWQDVLGIERVGIHDSFFELGGDSLVGLKLIAQVQKQLQVEIPAVDLYKGPTVSRLADMVEQLTGRVEDDGAAQDMGRRRGELRLERRRRQGGRPARSPTPADER